MSAVPLHLGRRPSADDASGSSAASQTTTSPLVAVLAAVRGGASTTRTVADRTGLALDVVTAAVEHLGRIGRLDVCAAGSLCATSGCGGCAVSSSCGSRTTE